MNKPKTVKQLLNAEPDSLSPDDVEALQRIVAINIDTFAEVIIKATELVDRVGQTARDWQKDD